MMSGQIKRGSARTPFSSPSSTCGKNEAKVIPIYQSYCNWLRLLKTFQKNINSRYIQMLLGSPSFLVEQVDDFGIRRRKKGNAEKYKSRAFQCKICKWGHSNKASKKVEEHKDECPAVWIFEEWQPQPLEDLKFVKS